MRGYFGCPALAGNRPFTRPVLLEPLPGSLLERPSQQQFLRRPLKVGSSWGAVVLPKPSAGPQVCALQHQGERQAWVKPVLEPLPAGKFQNAAQLPDLDSHKWMGHCFTVWHGCYRQVHVAKFRKEERKERRGKGKHGRKGEGRKSEYKTARYMDSPLHQACLGQLRLPSQ